MLQRHIDHLLDFGAVALRRADRHAGQANRKAQRGRHGAAGEFAFALGGTSPACKIFKSLCDGLAVVQSTWRQL